MLGGSLELLEILHGNSLCSSYGCSVKTTTDFSGLYDKHFIIPYEFCKSGFHVGLDWAILLFVPLIEAAQWHLSGR